MAGHAHDHSSRDGQIQPAPRPNGRGAPAERGFDVWLARRLTALYGAMADGDLPDDISELLDRAFRAHGAGD